MGGWLFVGALRMSRMLGLSRVVHVHYSSHFGIAMSWGHEWFLTFISV